MKKNLIQQAKNVAAIRPEALAAGEKNGIVIDRAGFLDALFSIQTGAVTGTPTATTIDIKVQHGDQADGTGMADVNVEGVLNTASKTGAITGANGEYTLPLNLTGLKQYVRLVATVAFTGGTSPTVLTTAVATLGNADNEPVV